MITSPNHKSALASDSEKLSLQSKSPFKDTFWGGNTEFTGWEDNTHEDAFNPHNSMNSSRVRKKSEVKELLPLKHLSRLKKKHESSLPEVVSAYEISKIHPRFKEFFDQPLKLFKEKEKFPAITNRSLLSVYLPVSLDRKMMRKIMDQRLQNKVGDQGKKDKRNRVKGLEPVGKQLAVSNAYK